MGERSAVLDDINKDIISSLPTNLIEVIVRRMPIREAARTSILSRNWRYIWATDPTLFLDKKFFDEMFKNKPNVQYEFVRAINKILLVHIGPITKFILYIPEFDLNQASDIDHWILVLSRNGIKQLSLENSNRVPYELHSYIFDCHELTHLHLCNCVLKPPLAFKGFNKLVYLSLEQMSFSVDVLGALLLPSAPVLQTLSFINCSGMENLRIQTPKLENIRVVGSGGFDWQFFETNPDLEWIIIVLQNEIENPQQGETLNLMKFFGNLRRTKELLMDGFFLKFLAARGVPKWLPNMNYQLTQLFLYSFGFNELDHISAALCLLRSSPNLRSLKIHAIAVSNNVMESAKIINHLEYPRCMGNKIVLNQLRTVNLMYLNGLKAELLFIKLVLACSPLLETLRVEVRNKIDVSEELRISRELLRFSRASPRADIHYVLNL